MRRTLLLLPALALAGAAALVAFQPGATRAQPDNKPAAPGAASAASPQLPVTQAILYSSGVGCFQREGQIDGTARVDLSFPVQDINDLLKSMVLQDLGGGAVSAVSYDSQAPIERTLASFAVNLTGNPAQSAILNQARGEKVEVTLQPTTATQPGTLTGNLLGVEKQKVQVGKDSVVEVEMLNLWCAEGLRSVKLNEVQRIRFLNPTLESEFRRALETLALSHDTQKKAVSLTFTGEGKRDVRVAYVVENPIWKTSYRLVLSNKPGNKPMLQGWAVVENASEEDWKDVRMALVSGRPISFKMDLYQPLFVPRPTVEPELFASLRPPTYTGAMGGAEGRVAVTPAAAGMPPGAMAPGMAGGMGGMGGRAAPTAARKAAEAADGLARGEAENRAAFGRAVRQRLSDDLQLQAGIASAATASQLGDFFQYVIEHPVTLPRQKSALLPIVQKDVDGSRVSIYNERTQPKHPLLGLKFKNTTGLHLMQGPVTVFEGSSYAGDARILDLQPGEERLLSYAVDLGTEVEPVAQRAPDRLTKVKLNKGILYQTTKVRESKTYNAKNRSEQERTLLIEHPFRADFTLVSEAKPAERARDVYRFELKLPSGQTGKLEVTEERDQVTQVVLTNADDQFMRFFISQPVVSEAVKKALGTAVELKGKLSATQRELAQQERLLKVITDDQQRLRANLKEMPPTAEAYKRYLKKFDDQETQIEQYQAKIKALQEQEHAERRTFEDFLARLDVE